MVDLVFLIAFIALPLAAWLITRKLTFVVVGLVLGFGLAGNFAQTTIALGVPWNVRTLQTASVLIMIIVLVVGLWHRRAGHSLRRQVSLVILPAIFVALFLIAMRAMADGAGPMSAIGYFINHPLAEDNAKWLHLSAQMSDGREIVFNGYAGGPLLLLMSVMAAMMSVLSIIWLGGINQVAVAANTVLATQFLLIALVPFAFAPFADRASSTIDSRPTRQLPAPLVWAGMLIALTASAVITSYGHLSLQFVLPILIVWVLCFVLHCTPRQRLFATLAIVTLASVWLPLNVLGVILFIGALGWTLWSRRWLELVLVLLTGLLSWDAVFTSITYMLGIDNNAPQSLTAQGGSDSFSDAESTTGSGGSVHLFQAPGGTEIAQPIIGLLTVVVILVVVWRLVGQGLDGPQVVARLTPVVILVGYAMLILVVDAIATGRGPNYGTNKLMFAALIAALAALLPLALGALDPAAERMTVLRWFAVVGVVVLLSVDTLLPRALSALSPVLWPGIDARAPQYWSVAEVNGRGEQPLRSLPVACLFLPQAGGAPTALPLGQESYTCSRLLVGLAGLEGSAGPLPALLQNDWLSNQSNWRLRLEELRSGSDTIADRTVIVMTPEGGVAGIALVSEVLSRP